MRSLRRRLDAAARGDKALSACATVFVISAAAAEKAGSRVDVARISLNPQDPSKSSLSLVLGV